MKKELCKCCERHVPLPTTYKYLKVDGQVVTVCPTTYENIQDLLTSFRVHDSIPPGSITKHYSRFVRGISLALWKESKMA